MNEYLKKYKSISKRDVLHSNYMSRSNMVESYSYAIPTEESIEKLVEISPIIEIGSGNGYWANLINEKGGDVVCYDIEPPEDSFYKVKQGSEEVINSYNDRTLFLCWPPLGSDMAYNCVNNYDGDTLVYIGETKGGCTANDKFFNYVREVFELEDIIRIPSWSKVEDNMFIYTR